MSCGWSEQNIMQHVELGYCVYRCVFVCIHTYVLLSQDVKIFVGKIVKNVD